MEKPSRSCSGVETRAYKTAVGPGLGRVASLARPFAARREVTCLLAIECTRLSVELHRERQPFARRASEHRVPVESQIAPSDDREERDHVRDRIGPRTRYERAVLPAI